MKKEVAFIDNITQGIHKSVFLNDFYKDHEITQINAKINYMLYKVIIYVANICLTKRQKEIFFHVFVLNNNRYTQFHHNNTTYQAKFNRYKSCLKNINKTLQFTGIDKIIEEVIKNEKIYSNKRNSKISIKNKERI